VISAAGRLAAQPLAADPVTGVIHMLGHGFIQNALLAGTSVGLLAGLVGYFVVLRGQVFAGDALSHVAYTGALAALAAGVDLRLGLFAATIAIGLALGLLGGRGSADDVVIGTTFSWVLGLGVFCLAYYTTHSATGNGAANANVLFGSIFGISHHAAATAALIALASIIVLAFIARPLLFSSIDPAVARARGVPVRLLGPLFLALVGVTAAEASQVVGAVLLLGLLAAPAAAAQQLTSNPWTAFALSGTLAVLAVWVGIALAYLSPKLPVSFTIIIVAASLYAAAAITALGQRRRRRPDPDDPDVADTATRAAGTAPKR
jgi:zinc/manganese transport system permease protein